MSAPSTNGLTESTDDGVQLTPAQLNGHIQHFLRDYLSEKSPETVGTYRRSLNEFERWFTATGGYDCRFRTRDIEAYKTHLMETKALHQVSVSTYLTAVRQLCAYLVEVQVLPHNPARAVKGNRRPSSHSRQILDQDEVSRILAAIPPDSDIAKRDRAIIFMMLFAGLSEIEIVRANFQDLEQTLLGWYLRVQGKGHTIKDQQVPIDPAVMDSIRLYLDTRGRIQQDEPLFVSHGYRSEGNRLTTRSVRSRINHHLEKAGVKRPGVSPHSLTHTAALIWLQDGMPVEEVQKRMRHGTLGTTMIYFRQQSLDKAQLDGTSSGHTSPVHP